MTSTSTGPGSAATQRAWRTTFRLGWTTSTLATNPSGGRMNRKPNALQPHISRSTPVT
jgi:hypothetical protein